MNFKPRVILPPSDDYWIGHIIEAAKRGNQRAARALMAEFVYWADVGEVSDPKLISFFADAFWRIIRYNEKPEQALNVLARRGRPERTIDERAKDLCLGMEALARVRLGYATYVEAIAQVAEEGHASTRKVEREYKTAREMRDDWARRVDPCDKHNLREFRPKWPSNDELERMTHSLKIANLVFDAKAEYESEQQARELVSTQEGIPIEEVNQALKWYDEWLMSL